MYDLTLLAIMRDSMPYMERFITQVNSLFQHFDKCHLIITEGNSIDVTKDYLADLVSDGNYVLKGDVTVGILDTGVNIMGSVNHPVRWRNLENAWNNNLKMLEPTNYAICVESDLIWSADVPLSLIDSLKWSQGDVMVPMLMSDRPQQGHYFYDTNAMQLNGKHFQNTKPYHPDWKDDERFMRLDTGGGMLVTYGNILSAATWKNNCVLHWGDGVRVVLDKQLEIQHP